MKWNQLDLKIQLSPSQAVGMQAMLEKFLAKKQHYFCAPVLDDSTLKINSSDFINFLDQAEFGNEFDLFRLKASALRAVGEIQKTKAEPLVIQHYKRCKEIIAEMK
jgi:hypothetical protein